MIGWFASTCPFPIFGNSLSDFRDFSFRFQVLLLYATHAAFRTAFLSSLLSSFGFHPIQYFTHITDFASFITNQRFKPMILRQHGHQLQHLIHMAEPHGIRRPIVGVIPCTCASRCQSSPPRIRSSLAISGFLRSHSINLSSTGSAAASIRPSPVLSHS